MKTASAPRVSGVTAWFSPAQKPLALCASSPAAGHAPMIAAPKIIAMASFIATRARGFRAPVFTGFCRQRPRGMESGLQPVETSASCIRIERRVLGSVSVETRVASPRSNDVAESAPGHRHRWHHAIVARDSYPLADRTGRRVRCRRLLCLRAIAVHTIRRDDRVEFTPLGLRKGNGKALVGLVAGLWQYGADDPGPERTSVDADTGAG